MIDAEMRMAIHTFERTYRFTRLLNHSFTHFLTHLLARSLISPNATRLNATRLMLTHLRH